MIYQIPAPPGPLLLRFGVKVPETVAIASMCPDAILVRDLDVRSRNTVSWVFVADKATIYIGDPSHLQDGTINYVHRRMQGAFIGKDETFVMLAFSLYATLVINPVWVWVLGFWTSQKCKNIYVG